MPALSNRRTSKLEGLSRTISLAYPFAPSLEYRRDKVNQATRELESARRGGDQDKKFRATLMLNEAEPRSVHQAEMPIDQVIGVWRAFPMEAARRDTDLDRGRGPAVGWSTRLERTEPLSELGFPSAVHERSRSYGLGP